MNSIDQVPVDRSRDGQQALPQVEPVAGDQEAASPDFADVLGQYRARRALRIATAGGTPHC